jgi:molybdate transport system ATP-binding protein
VSFDVRMSKRLGARTIQVEFATGAGVTALFGASGAGKTSVLNMIAGVMTPDSGRIAVGGEVLYDSDRGIALRPEQRRAGYIFQDGRLFPHRTVRQNLLYGAKLRAADEAHVTFEHAVELLDIGSLLDRRPATLSGGEAQRVAIGRALLAAPRFFLMDEPLTYLDETRRGEMFGIIARLRDEMRLPILYVTHDRDELARLEATAIVMERDMEMPAGRADRAGGLRRAEGGGP